jgi:thioredoxin 1
MGPIELTRETFTASLPKEGIVLIDWWASWCGPCHMFAPVFEAAASRHPNVVFAKVDVDAQPELASQFGIMAMPTLMAIRDSVVLFSQPGALPGNALDQLIKEVAALDMKALSDERPAAPAGG